MKKACFILGLIFLILLLLFPFSKNENEYTENCNTLFECKDIYISFGDGEFFVMNITGHKSLFNWEVFGGTVVMADLDRYITYKDYVYLEGYYGMSSSLNENKEPPFVAYDISTGESLIYNRIEDIPRYVILNYRTNEVRFYLTIEDIPEEDRKMFEKDLGWWCKLKKTCYEE